MKYLVGFMLLITALCAKAQDAIIVTKQGKKVTANITAVNDKTIFTDAGSYNFDKVWAVDFKLYDPKFENSYAKIRNQVRMSFEGHVNYTDADFNLLKGKSPMHIENLPFTPEGKLMMEEVVTQSGSADELYSRAKLFFAETFKSANEVIQMDDPDSHTLVGKGYSQLLIVYYGEMTQVRMYYTAKIQTKEGRYRYNIYDIYFQSGGNDTYPETVFLKQNMYTKKGKEKKIERQYYNQTQARLLSLTSSIRTLLRSPVNSSDW